MPKNHLKNSIKLAFASITLVVGILLLLYGVLTKDYINVSYTEDNSINYKVYLKENNYFETKYLEENRTYIASLIDYIDVDYKYIISFSEPVTGNYRYYIKAIIYANKPNGETGYYWAKDYDLTKPEEIKVENKDSYIIMKNIKVDYAKYNQILNDFKKEYSMQTSGKLVVNLVVKGTMQGKEYTKEIPLTSELKLSMPLLEQTVEASIEKDAVSSSKTLTMLGQSNKLKYLTCIIVGIGIISGALLVIIEVIIYSIQKNKRNLYKTELEKILRNHDSIIANVSSLPKTDDLNIIKVMSFTELLDVYNEVRMPINYYQNPKRSESIFMIINDGIAWIYKLTKEEYTEGNHKES